MYSSKVDDKILAFGHEGVLYRRSFVMYDRGTGSIWVHTTGECVKGKLKGKQLKFIPSVVTRWGDWKDKYPNSKILEGKKAKGFMGSYRLTKKKDKFGISVGEGEQSNLYPIVELEKQRVIHDTLGEDKIVIFFDTEGQFATAWKNPENRQFKWDGEQQSFVDQQGKPLNMMLGGPVSDLKSDSRMRSLPATAWLIQRWKGFYPKSRIFKSSE